MGRGVSDEMYVLDLCDLVLGEVSLRQHRFEWLLGDPNANGRQAKLPVDAYWPGHRLVVEYREIQHDEPVPHFDKPHVVTVSGVHRGEQRAIYDARRDELIPRNGLRLVVIKPSALAADSRGRLLRDPASDEVVLSKLLSPASDEQRVLDAFRCWLIAEGWTPVSPADAHTDIEAVRGDERIIGEAKGHTADKGTDADTGYGQLLRKMTATTPRTRYALIVPSSSVPAAQRVPVKIRRMLNIDVFEVSDDNAVRLIES